MFVILFAWLVFEAFKVIPNISEYYIVSYRQNLSLIEDMQIE
jgi:hypothetical protein